jgi:hypothetical protein
MLASAIVAHSHLVSLNGYRVPPSKSPLKWNIPHPVKHAELVYVMQVLQMIPRPTAAAITANLTLYNTIDLSGYDARRVCLLSIPHSNCKLQSRAVGNVFSFLAVCSMAMHREFSQPHYLIESVSFRWCCTSALQFRVSIPLSLQQS